MNTQVVFDQRETQDVLAIQRELEEGTLETNFYVRLLGLKTFDTLKLFKKIEAGLTFASFARLQRNIGLTQDQLGEIVQIRRRTLVRRKQAGKLEPTESDRLLRTSRIFGHALQLFEGDGVAARAWMRSPLRALGNISPLEACRSELGASEIDKVIGRLEHGVFS